MNEHALAEIISDRDSIFVGTGVSEPQGIITKFANSVDKVRGGVNLFQVMTPGPELLAGTKLLRTTVHTPVPGRLGRRAIRQGTVQLMRKSISEICMDIDTGRLPIDGVFFTGISIGKQTVAPALAVDLLEIAIRRSRYVAVEMTDGFPLCETSLKLPLSQCNYVMRTHRKPEPVTVRSTENAARIGELVAGLIEDGAAVEIGIGGALGGLAKAIGESGKQVSVHSGLISDWLPVMLESGCLRRDLSCSSAVAVGAVAAGTKEFYRWLGDTAGNVELLPSNDIHNAEHLRALNSFTAVNSALYFDLRGLVGDMWHDPVTSGIGGLADFAKAAGQRSIVAMESTFPDGTSRIVAKVSVENTRAGAISHLVTEFGVARLSDCDSSEMADRIISVAHPHHRDALIEDKIRATNE